MRGGRRSSEQAFQSPACRSSDERGSGGRSVLRDTSSGDGRGSAARESAGERHRRPAVAVVAAAPPSLSRRSVTLATPEVIVRAAGGTHGLPVPPSGGGGTPWKLKPAGGGEPLGGSPAEEPGGAPGREHLDVPGARAARPDAGGGSASGLVTATPSVTLPTPTSSEDEAELERKVSAMFGGATQARPGLTRGPARRFTLPAQL